MIFALDFDGTIVDDAYPEIGHLNGLAEYFIREMKARGHTFILWTNRCGKQLEEAVNFLQANGLAPDYVNENTPELIEQYGNDCRKVFADYYIDDRNPGGVKWPWVALESRKYEV